MSRCFSKQQRDAVSLVSGLDASELHADHINPHANGGETTVENCQLISPSVNRSKSDAAYVPREWQQRFQTTWESRTSGNPFLMVAVPGGGKTAASLECARLWMAAGPDRRIIVVVPTTGLQEQWRDEATRFGINLQTSTFGTNFKSGYQGCAVTYQSINSDPLVFRKCCSVAPTMVIFDEMHHCGDNASFGVAVKEAFGLAKERLMLSGTPWKTSGEAIPFVNYTSDGYCIADFIYEQKDAIQDDVVRWISFDWNMGQITYAVTGDTDEFNLSISDDDASRLLRKFLRPDGSFVRECIRKAHAKLIECRITMPDAAGLIACIDRFHAEQMARVLKEETGESASIIVSDSDTSTDTIKDFRKSNKKWLISVRMVSEGTDIKKLQVLCYFTNWVTELFFRQLVGRVARKISGKEDFEAYVFMPSDPRLLKFAENIDNMQVQGIRETFDGEQRDATEQRERTLFDDVFTTEHLGTEGLTIAGRHYTAEAAAKVQQIANSIGVTQEKAAKFYDEFLLPTAPASVALSQESEPESLESRAKSIGNKCAKLAFRLSKLIDVHVKEIHARFKPQKEMAIGELGAKHNLLQQWIAEASKR